MSRLAGKVAAVTGGASGMGRATVMRFLADGAKVVVADLNEANGAETLAVAKAQGHGDSVLGGDLFEAVGDVRAPERDDEARADAIDPV